MKQDKIINVQGVPLTEPMKAELQRWNIGSRPGDNVAADLVATLSKMQDYFCTQLCDVDYDDTEAQLEIADYIRDVGYLKFSLSPFAEITPLEK